MRTYILGAGASSHVGYPLTPHLWDALAKWLSSHEDAHFRNLKEKIEKEQPSLLGDVERLMTKLKEDTQRWLRHAISGFFNEIRTQPAPAYSLFAEKYIHSGDTIITFNFDVSLERELKLAGKWEVGNGYGFNIHPKSELKSPVQILKLHGSTNWMGNVQIGQTLAGSVKLGDRPVIYPEDLKFLGYHNLQDRHYDVQNVGYERALVLPTFDKKFPGRMGVDVNWEKFWKDLWNQAANSFERATEIIIHGYSMSAIDEKPRDLFLNRSNRAAEIKVYCLNDSVRIAKKFRERGFVNVYAFPDIRFEDQL